MQVASVLENASLLNLFQSRAHVLCLLNRLEARRADWLKKKGGDICSQTYQPLLFVEASIHQQVWKGWHIKNKSSLLKSEVWQSGRHTFCSPRATHLTAKHKTNREQVGRNPYLGIPEDLQMTPNVAWAGTQACENSTVELLSVNGVNHFSSILH